VGTNRDRTERVRAVRSKDKDADTRLLTGWREEVCGDLLLKVLEGRVRFRVAPDNAATPLVFEEHS
jgi:hypothetical protein